MFRILVVDDNPSIGEILRVVAKDLRHPTDFSFVGDGEEALRFLHRLDPYAQARRPHLILLDMDMPRLDGLATLSAIKTDPDLRIIPVIVFTTVVVSKELRRSYQAYANAFVQKPSNLQSSMKFIKALEAFWMDFARLPDNETGSATSDDRLILMKTAALSPQPVAVGPQIAQSSTEGASRDLEDSLVKPVFKRWRRGCEEYDRLQNQFAAAVREVIELHEQQYSAIVEGDEEAERFDLLIHMANEKKQAAKYDYLQHVEVHACINSNGSEQT